MLWLTGCADPTQFCSSLRFVDLPFLWVAFTDVRIVLRFCSVTVSLSLCCGVRRLFCVRVCGFVVLPLLFVSFGAASSGGFVSHGVFYFIVAGFSDSLFCVFIVIVLLDQSLGAYRLVTFFAVVGSHKPEGFGSVNPKGFVLVKLVVLVSFCLII